MSRPRRNRALVAAAIATALTASALLTGGCSMFQKAPVLTQEQLAAAIVPQKHPVSQQDAMKMGCKCHIDAAKAAGQ